MRVGVLVTVLTVSAAAAVAGGYDDFTRGIVANDAGKSDAAISSFTGALKAGDLAATYVPDAYYGRAIAYLRSGNCAAARSDVDAAIKLSPQKFDALLLRVQLDDCLGNDEAQASDIEVALHVKPSATLSMALAQVKWRKGDFPGASEDFLAAIKLQPKDTPFYLWSAAALMHAGTFDPATFAKLTSDVGRHEWPGPLFELYRGKTTPDEVLAAAGKEDDFGKKVRLCQANFFIAEWNLWKLDTAAAKLRLQEAAGCREAYFIRRAAMYDFAQLK